ncbi:protein FATTY ACID EXPORT 3, chloroplastic-like isoform X2 [Bidens hawaiensis]|uniref:protein FATTY ACID EXPORT 3, chloroplastic-like isoform X2 n=1 Tax=Bidens hawaiensis TaxID=980011 RepID=UPI00404A0A4A
MAAATRMTTSTISTTANPNQVRSKRPPMDSLCLPRPRSHGVLSLSAGYPRNRSFSASHQDSNSSDIEIEEETSRLKEKAEESEEAWKQTLASFKEQALKMLNVSQEAYEVYLKKATVILKETSEQLKIQADKASEDLSVIAKEIGEEGKVYLSAAAENSPEPVKDIVKTFASSTDDLKDVSEVLDFYVGIPYGGLLTVGGFLSFMITGSISAIRFGVILGGTLLVLAVYSLRSWKKGESSSSALKGQAAIATILFLRDLRLVFSRPAFTRYIALIISGVALAFYVYRITYVRGQSTGESSFGTEAEN